MSSSTTKTSLGRQTIAILNANSLGFILISLLFLPFTFVASASIQFYLTSAASSSSPDTDITTYFDPFNLLLIKTLITNSRNLIIFKTLITIVMFTFFIILPAIIGIALITYNTIHTIRRRPLTFSSAFKSLSRSYIPLLSTTIIGSTKIILMSLFFILSPISITESIKILGFHFDLVAISIITNTIASYILVITILFFIVSWGSSVTIAVILESKSGFESLLQNTNQSTKFRFQSFFIAYRIGVVIVASLSYSAIAAPNLKLTTYWILIFQVGLIYLQSSLMILYYVVANTVLYVQCKVACSEEIALLTVEREVSGEYVPVVVDDKGDEVSHELFMGDAKGGFIYMMCLLFIVWVILLFFMML